MQWWWRLGLGPSCHQVLLRWEFSLFLLTTIFFPISIVSRQLCCCCCCYRCWKKPWYAFGFSFFPFKQVQRIFDWMTKKTSKTRLLFFCCTNFCRLLLVPPVAEIFLSLGFYRFIFFAGNFFISFLLEFICCRLHLLPRKTSAFLRRVYCVFNKLQFWRLQTLSFSIADWVCHVIASTMFFLSRFAISVGHRVSKFNWIFLFCFKFHFHSLTICYILLLCPR